MRGWTSLQLWSCFILHTKVYIYYCFHYKLNFFTLNYNCFTKKFHFFLLWLQLFVSLWVIDHPFTTTNNILVRLDLMFNENRWSERNFIYFGWQTALWSSQFSTSLIMAEKWFRCLCLNMRSKADFKIDWDNRASLTAMVKLSVIHFIPLTCLNNRVQSGVDLINGFPLVQK